MSDALSWSTPAMQEGHQAIVAACSKLTNENEQLKQELRPMAEAWVGEGQASWSVVQARWDQSMLDMLDVLNKIGMALDRATNIYTDTERSIVGGWGN